MKPSVTTTDSTPKVNVGGNRFTIDEFWDSGLLWDNGGFWDTGAGLGLPPLSVATERLSALVETSVISIGVFSRKPSGTIN